MIFKYIFLFLLIDIKCIIILKIDRKLKKQMKLLKKS